MAILIRKVSNLFRMISNWIGNLSIKNGNMLVNFLGLTVTSERFWKHRNFLEQYMVQLTYFLGQSENLDQFRGRLESVYRLIILISMNFKGLRFNPVSSRPAVDNGNRRHHHGHYREQQRIFETRRDPKYERVSRQVD